MRSAPRRQKYATLPGDDFFLRAISQDMSHGTLLTLEYRGDEHDTIPSGFCSGQRIQLAYCDENAALVSKCASFCTNSERCAEFIRRTVENASVYSSLSSNQVCTSDFVHNNGEQFHICIPNALLEEDAIKRGTPCRPPICEWRKKERCVTDTEALPSRPNDGSFEYVSCCRT